MDTRRGDQEERSGQAVFTKLSPREKEVTKCIQEGKTNREIARLLNIGQNTVKTHVSTILRKLDVENRTQAAMKAVALNL